MRLDTKGFSHFSGAEICIKNKMRSAIQKTTETRKQQGAQRVDLLVTSAAAVAELRSDSAGFLGKTCLKQNTRSQIFFPGKHEEFIF